MTREEARKRARLLAAESNQRGDPLGWFEPLYSGAIDDLSRIPWADRGPCPLLVEWLEEGGVAGPGAALVVGCGLGDDAELLAARGFQVTAFDLAPSAVELCRRRFPHSTVQYRAGDLFATPPDWDRAFHLVVEVFTLQALPPAARAEGFERLARLVAPQGRLLVIARAREAHEAAPQLPWPLTREELAAVPRAGLLEERFEDFLDREDPPVRRFRASYRRTRG